MNQKEWLDSKILNKLTGDTPTSNGVVIEEMFNLGLVKGGLKQRMFDRVNVGNYALTRMGVNNPYSFDVSKPGQIVEIHALCKFSNIDDVWGIFGSENIDWFMAGSRPVGTLSFYSSTTGSYIPFNNSVPFSSFMNNKPIWFGIKLEYDGSVTAYVNGVQFGNKLMNQFNNIKRFKYVLSGYGSYAESDGEVYACYAFNRALTDAERARICRLDIPENLSTAGFNAVPVNNIMNGQAGWNDYTSMGWDGNTLSVSGDANAAGHFGISLKTYGVKIGDTIRVSGNVTSFSSTEIAMYISQASGFDPIDGYNVITTTGTFEFTITITSPLGIWLTFRNNDYTVARSFTITDFKIEIQGCLLRLEPENIVPSGRWIDISGNCNDLGINVGAPPEKIFNPLPSYTRVFSAYIPSTGIATETPVAINTNFDFDTKYIAAAKVGDSLYFNSTGGFATPSIYDKTGLYVPSDGVINTTLISLNGDSPTGTRVGYVKHIIS